MNILNYVKKIYEMYTINTNQAKFCWAFGNQILQSKDKIQCNAIVNLILSSNKKKLIMLIAFHIGEYIHIFH